MSEQRRASRAVRARAAISGLVLRGRHLLATDIAAIVVSYVGAFALRFDGPSSSFTEYLTGFWWPLPLLVVARLVAFMALGLYQRVWRFASVAELESILLAVGSSSLVAYSLIYFVAFLNPSPLGFPRSIPFIETLITTALIGGSRFGLLLFGVARRGATQAGGTRALIVGAGAAGAAVARQLAQDASLGLVPIGFVDDHETRGHRLLGLRVLGSIDELGSIVRERGIATVLFALPHIDGPTLRRLVRLAERANARCLTVPSISEVVTGQVTSSIREIQMDDLLRRAPATSDLDAIRDVFQGRDVLITGAGGSIGSELSRQLLRYSPRRLIVLGRGENSIYELLEGLTSAKRDGIGETTELVPVIMDLRDRAGLHGVFQRHAPEVVFHAAAHKHVGFMERFPREAVLTNVIGTQNAIAACEAAGVGRFIFVSTDKAVRPTSVMGATKRIGELLVRTAAERTGRPFVTVRFGNVLSSRGSVVPRFRRQLSAGGPLTVTHPQVRRYFMTISEAVQLILQATILGERGETFVLDMGAPVLIAELARDLIGLHGLVPDRDIQIVYTGLDAGEKLEEELFFPDERPRKTSHDSIWVAADGAPSIPSAALAALTANAVARDDDAVIDALRALVPEYRPTRDRMLSLEPTTFEGGEGQ